MTPLDYTTPEYRKALAEQLTKQKQPGKLYQIEWAASGARNVPGSTYRVPGTQYRIKVAERSWLVFVASPNNSRTAAKTAFINYLKGLPVPPWEPITRES